MKAASRVFAVLSLLCLAAFLSYVGLIISHHVSGVDRPEGNWAWIWIGAGIYGGLGALLFGILTLAFWRAP